MAEEETGYILFDVCFDGQLVSDVKLPRACSLENIVQGLWLDDNFRKAGFFEYLNTKEDTEAQNSDGGPSSSLKNFGGMDTVSSYALGDRSLNTSQGGGRWF